MRKVTLNDLPRFPRNESLFTNTVFNQTILEHEESDDFNCAIVNFPASTRTKYHTHSGDQILIITDGFGKVCSENEELDVKRGDVILINAGENHWHGASNDFSMSHITITVSGSKTTQTEE